MGKRIFDSFFLYYIRKNPGSHTAIISKLMGHAWRSMSIEEQRPYTYVFFFWFNFLKRS